SSDVCSSDLAGGRGGRRCGRDRGDEGEARRHRPGARGERESRIGPELRPGSGLGVDADAHVLRLHRGELVGHVVPRGRAWRRRLCGAADAQREGRETLVTRDAVVQHRALCRTALALDSRGAGVPDLVSRAAGPGDRLHPGDDRLPAVIAPRPLVAAFAAAFMSTIATQLNWGASYLVNDFYRRLVRRDASEPHYVLASRLATALLTVISAAVAFRIESIGGAWKLLIITGAGTGAVLLLRWYWWRINAWSEVAAMITAFVVSVLLQTVGGLDSDRPLDFARIVLVTVAVTTVVWLVVTFATRPETDATL